MRFGSYIVEFPFKRLLCAFRPGSRTASRTPALRRTDQFGIIHLAETKNSKRLPTVRASTKLSVHACNVVGRKGARNLQRFRKPRFCFESEFDWISVSSLLRLSERPLPAGNSETELRDDGGVIEAITIR